MIQAVPPGTPYYLATGTYGVSVTYVGADLVPPPATSVAQVTITPVAGKLGPTLGQFSVRLEQAYDYVGNYQTVALGSWSGGIPTGPLSLAVARPTSRLPISYRVVLLPTVSPIQVGVQLFFAGPPAMLAKG